MMLENFVFRRSSVCIHNFFKFVNIEDLENKAETSYYERILLLIRRSIICCFFHSLIMNYEVEILLKSIRTLVFMLVFICVVLSQANLN